MLITSSESILSQGLQKLTAERRSLLWVEDFLYAGVASLLLVIARLLTQFSPLYLLALLPYVWRTLHADRPRSIRLGAFLATSFALVAYADHLVENPWAFGFQLFYLNLIFISYGVAVHRARKVFGASPLFVIYLWLPIEYCLNNLAGEGKLFAISVVDPSLLLRLSVLLHLLIIPLFIILLNPLLLLLSSYIVSRVIAERGLRLALPEKIYHAITILIRIRYSHSIPYFRGPPACPCLC
ncbi:MAG: hypothetical protein E4G91_06615 [Candidatus Zixiibacteriota bacterium]|nr:MAG: hypothetical protein E4G91_06615 [candidate division Zixibacteria bacterium]